VVVKGRVVRKDRWKSGYAQAEIVVLKAKRGFTACGSPKNAITGL